MLLQFSVGNFRSFDAVQTLSMEALLPEADPWNVVEVGPYRLLKTVALYGANASGKSNFLQALGAVRYLVVRQVYSFEHEQDSSTIPFDPFLRKHENRQLPTEYEVVFLLEGVKYRYGLEHNGSAILAEWLFETQPDQEEEALLFQREEQTFEIQPGFSTSSELKTLVRKDVPLLTVAAQFNQQPALKIIKGWFIRLNTVDISDSQYLRKVTEIFLSNNEIKNKLMEWYRRFDLGFEDVFVEEERFLTRQQVYDASGKPLDETVTFDAMEQESGGTNKILDISGVFYDTLHVGKILVVDELDARLHPFLSLTLLRMFQQLKSNPKHAQFIFSTHDTHLLKYGELRKDQIYFTEKTPTGATELYTMAEFQSEAALNGTTPDFEQEYIHGRFGGIPYLDAGQESHPHTE